MKLDRSQIDAVVSKIKAELSKIREAAAAKIIKDISNDILNSSFIKKLPIEVSSFKLTYDDKTIEVIRKPDNVFTVSEWDLRYFVNEQLKPTPSFEIIQTDVILETIESINLDQLITRLVEKYS